MVFTREFPYLIFIVVHRLFDITTVLILVVWQNPFSSIPFYEFAESINFVRINKRKKRIDGVPSTAIEMFAIDGFHFPLIEIQVASKRIINITINFRSF